MRARNICVKALAAGVVAATLAALSSGAAAASCSPGDIDASLAAIASGGEDALAPAAALAVMRGGETVYAGAAGCAQIAPSGGCALAMTPHTKFRAASVSKLAAGFAALALVAEGVFDLDKDVSAYYGFPVRNPAFPDAAITGRQLLSHTSSVRDPAAYWVAAPGMFRLLIEDNPALFADPNEGAGAAPGGDFVYANLNFGLLAGALEHAAGARFDDIVRRRVLAPLKLGAGFNWSGVAPEERRRGATLYRRADGAWAAQVDAADGLEGDGPHILAEPGLDRRAYLARYRPGDNPTLFSPQGGLRASVVELALLARAARPGGAFARAGEAQWTYDPARPNGDAMGGLYEQYGLAAQIVAYDAGERPTLVGHAGEAYGLLSGAWAVRAGEGGGREVSFAYAVTGTGEDVAPGEKSGFTAIEERLIDTALRAAACDPAEGRAR